MRPIHLLLAAVLAAPAAAQPVQPPRKNVAIFVHDGVELLDFAGPAEVFAAAGRGRAYRVYTVAADDKAIVSQGFLTVKPQYTLANCPRPDILVLPGGNTRIPLKDERVTAWVKKSAPDAEIVLSVCTGAFLLAKAGLLDGKEATTHWGAIERLKTAAPRTKVHADRRFVDNGKIVTAAGVSAGIDAALHVVDRQLGRQAARDTARYMEYRWEEPPAAAKAARVPGVVINHSPAKTKQYLGSPSIAVVGGEVVVSHDYFGPGSTRDVTLVFASADKGKTWQKRAEIKGQWWSSLFVHKGDLYLLGTSREYGHCVVRRSRDGGKTWTTPKDRDSGLLHGDGKYHCAPVPVVVHQGRLWRAMEDAEGPGKWGSHFRAFMMSAPVDADLLKADSWTSSNRLGRDPKWLDGRFGGWLEGNAVVTPGGEIVNILRTDCRVVPEKAAIVRISKDGKSATFDPAADFIDFPGGAKKFTIRFDTRTKRYWTLANRVKDEFAREKNVAMVRNTLSLMSSADLRTWVVHRDVLAHPDVKTHGFQYVDWQFEGDDLIAVVRTAHDDGQGGARNAHDSNYVIFHRVKGFRQTK